MPFVSLAAIGPSCNPLFAPHNGTIDCLLGDDEVATSGDKCTFSCDDGFELSGSRRRRCRVRNNRGKWTGSRATCDVLSMI